jgi:hypothetical protein
METSQELFNINTITIPQLSSIKYPCIRLGTRILFGLGCSAILTVSMYQQNHYIRDINDLKKLVPGIIHILKDRCYVGTDTESVSAVQLQTLKDIYRSHQRRKTLIYCNQLQDQLDEYMYRPGKTGYMELTRANKNKFCDLLES